MTIHAHVSRPAMALSRRAGFSLIELTIAVLLGALVVAGLVNVLIANRQAYHLQESTNFNQQNMRFALEQIGWSVRMADFWGGVQPDSISVSTGSPPTITGSGSCNSAWGLDFNNGVYGYDGQPGTGTFPIAGCVNAADYVPGTDVLVVRYADTNAIPYTGTSGLLGTGEVFLITRAGMAGLLFGGDGTDSRPMQYPFYDGGALADGTYTYAFAIEMYFLRPCSVPDANGGADCSATSDGGNPIPTLVRMRLTSAGTLTTEPVVEGVEQLQFEYGVRDPSSGTEPINYLSASEMPAASDWANVVSVRIGYVLRAETRDIRQPHPLDTHNGTDDTSSDYPLRLSDNCHYSITKTGVIDTSGCANFSATSVGSATYPAQQFLRTEMTALVQARNRTRQ